MKKNYLICLFAVILFLGTSYLSGCRKSPSQAVPQLDSPAYSIFPGAVGVNDLSMVFTNDGNLALLGLTADGNGLLYKLTQSGNQLMNKGINLSGINQYGPPSISSLVQTSDNGYMICGSCNVQSTNLGVTNISSDVFLMKTDAAGNTLWTKTYGGSDEDYGAMIIPTKDGKYLICGTSYSYTTDAFDDIYLVKVDVNGDTLWTRAYPRQEQQTPFNVLETKNGDYLVVGTDEPTGDGRIVYLLRVDAHGNKLWDNSLGVVDISHYKWAYCAAECPNGDLMIGGETDSKVLLIRTNNAGNEVWEKTYTTTDTSFCAGMSMKVNADKSCVITGMASKNGFPSSGCFLLKTDENGNEVFMKKFTGTGSFAGYNLLINKNGDCLISGYLISDPAGTHHSIFLTRTDAQGNYK